MDLDKIIAENDDGSGKFDAATVKKIVTAALSATELAKLGELLDTATRLEGMAMQAATNSSKQVCSTYPSPLSPPPPLFPAASQPRFPQTQDLC